MTDVTTATSLMKMALALLDRTDEQSAACHLQAAIDAIEKRGPMLPGDTISEADELRYLGPIPIAAN
ncbi:hypothetical protein KZ820_20815 [Sphingomonas sp. RRHST34]|uniref:Uncharacterized protein n=1 Tax=Sphingomonas citri TaxID=2862499 RepID=A0ABS7BUD0_9SPHN|nr:hypothetical protein [Sphingomonas citri]MBW6533191.1 hypothetical protein [Sphingomonas citri]